MSYETCREAFDLTLVPTTPMNRWQILQENLYRWQTASYGLPQPALMCLGIVEELGELAEARTGADTDDAVADVTIFAIQLATCYRLDIGVLVEDANREILGQTMAFAGRLCHAVLKSEQKIRGMGDRETARRAVYEALLPVLGHCLVYSGGDAFAYLKNVSEVASKVMKRKKSELPQVVR